MSPRSAGNRPVILVTSAFSGVGNTCATWLAKKGYVVYGTCPDPASHQRRADELYEPLAMDLLSSASVAEAIDRVTREQGRLDAIIHTVIPSPVLTVAPVTDPGPRDALDTGYFGLIRLLQATLPILGRSGGRVLVTSLSSARGPMPFRAHEAALNAALRSMIASIRIETADSGVQFSLVELGLFHPMLPGQNRPATGAMEPVPQAADNQEAALVHRAARYYCDPGQASSDPVHVARFMLRLLMRKRLGPTYYVGRPGELLYGMLATCLPALAEVLVAMRLGVRLEVLLRMGHRK